LAWNRDLQWWNEHCSKLQEEYPGKWIAILDQKVVAVGDDSSDLIEGVKSRFGRMPFVVYCRPKGYIRIRRKMMRLAA